MCRRLLYWLLLVCCFSHAGAQEPYVKHYTVHDGLPASNVYKALMDREGFLWLCTANGVSRFNGHTFTNYNLTNGFPGHGAFTGATDDRGRLWFVTFHDRACYYDGHAFHTFATPYPVSWVLPGEKGNIVFLTTKGHLLYYRDDRLLQDIIVDDSKLFHACFIAPGKLITQTTKGRYAVVENGRVRFLPHLFPVRTKFFRLRNGRIIISTATGIYEYRHDSLALLYRQTSPAAVAHIVTDVYDDGAQYWMSAENGLFRCAQPFDPARAQMVVPKSMVVSALGDKDGNLWFATFREGLYTLHPPVPTGVFLPNDKIRTLVAVSGERQGREVFLFYDDGLVRAVRAENGAFRVRDVIDIQAPFTGLCRRPDNGLIIYTTLGHHLLKDDRLTPAAYCRYCFHEGENRLYLLDERDWRVLTPTAQGDSMVLPPMSAAVRTSYTRLYGGPAIRALAIRNDTVWFGNENGLFRYTRGRIDRPSAHPVVQAYTSGIAIGRDGELWVATRGTGAYNIRNGVVTCYGEEQGIAALNCNSVYVDDTGDAWIASQEGLYRVDRRGAVTSLNHRSLLPTFEVSQVYRSGNTVFAVTASGLSIFDARSAGSNPPAPVVRISGVTVNGKEQAAVADLQLKHDESHVRIDFNAIDYSSVRPPSFRYCLSGKDPVWTAATQPYVDFSYLPPGTYTFYVTAVNGDGRKSAPAALQFVIRAPFWQTAWFFSLAILTVLSILFLVLRHYRRLGIRERQFAESELRSLRLHMNPHFIFNTLNSLQVFIFDNRPLDANLYIVRFSRLIRWVMHYSDRQEITLQEELEFLNNYIDLEQLRFGNTFSWRLEVDPDLDTGATFIPALVVQPFVENAIRHGLAAKEGTRFLEIKVQGKGHFLHVTIRDNGVGREQAMAEQALSPRESRSTGIRYTRERLRLLSTRKVPEEQVQITDLFENGQPAGTRILLLIPIAHEPHQRNDRRR